ncbi:MipA/OmpV family protein [Zavarzinia compransoris]|nr:MipA/OmpV family protein [Zavarzinia compransoris]TDP46871.1 outer membrane protein [Zavarzinia compransoris]
MRGFLSVGVLGVLAGAVLGAVAAVGVAARADFDYYSSTFRASGSDMAALGVGYGPEFTGADSSVVAPAAYLHTSLGDGRFVELVGTMLTANFLADPQWQIGPALNFRQGRKSADDAVVERLHEVDDSWEVGLSIGWQLQDPNNARNRLRLGVDLLQDVSGGHKGLVADFTALYRQEVVARVDLGVLAGVTVATGDYMNDALGVTAADAAASGLAAYKPGGGFRDIRIAPLAVLHLSENWQLGATVGWARLIGNAADSPIVRDRGSENQIFASVSLGYAW